MIVSNLIQDFELIQAGLYFNKIQCFCFEEQRLLPGEKIDMPVSWAVLESLILLKVFSLFHGACWVVVEPSCGMVQVFFFIDPEFATDPKMDGINSLILSYTFFKVEEAPQPS